jgi:hypothetical protein
VGLRLVPTGHILMQLFYCVAEVFLRFFGTAFLGTAFLAGALASLPPIKLNASAALNGNCFTVVCPVVLRVISTRRLLAKRMVRILRTMR